MACEVLRGRNGDIGGVIDKTAGTKFGAKINTWQVNVQRELFDESGFGDGGNTYFCEGVNQWAGGAVGLAVAGTGTAGFDPSSLSGTNTAFGTVSLTADNGVVYYGSCYVFGAELDTAYRGGGVRIRFQFRGHGPLNR